MQIHAVGLAENSNGEFRSTLNTRRLSVRFRGIIEFR